VSVVAVCVTLATAACGEDDNRAKTRIFLTTVAPTVRHPRCLDVPGSMVNAIRRKLTPEGRRSLRYAQAVKSNDFGSVYFVSADIEAVGLAGRNDVATWATERLRPGGLIYSVDPLANKYSDWPDGWMSAAQLTMADDGAELSQQCVKAVAKK
jgi:hypothetical protein